MKRFTKALNENLRTSVKLMTNLAAENSQFVILGLVIALFMMVGVFALWKVVTGLTFPNEIAAANSYFTLLTFGALLASIIIQGISVSKQIEEMKAVSKAQRDSTDALQTQIELMLYTSTLQVWGAEANLLESDERYKILQRDAGIDVNSESDEYLKASKEIRKKIAMTLKRIDDVERREKPGEL